MVVTLDNETKEILNRIAKAVSAPPPKEDHQFLTSALSGSIPTLVGFFITFLAFLWQRRDEVENTFDWIWKNMSKSFIGKKDEEKNGRSYGIVQDGTCCADWFP